MIQDTLSAGQDLASVAGRLYGNTSYFRELADLNQIDIFSVQSLVGATLNLPTLAELEQLAQSAVTPLINEAVLDLGGIRRPESLGPNQLLEWLL
jgi:hypothetical protein